MSITKKWKIISSSPEQTEKIGIDLATKLSGGEIFELSSDLGGGKTTLTKGLAKGLGISEPVTSPTFVVSKVYSGDKLELHHYDFYRLQEIGIMGEEIQEVISNVDNITVVEWAGESHNLLPLERVIFVEIRPLADEELREIVFTIPENFTKLVKGIGATEC